MATMARRLAPLLAVALLAGCGGATTPTPAPSPSATPIPASPSPSATPSPSPTAIPTPVPTPSPTAVPTPAPTVAPTARPTPAAGFTCAYPFEGGRPQATTSFIDDVRVGAHPGYDRIVFDFGATRIPQFTIEKVEPPFEQDPSGLPLTVPGTSFIEIRMVQASGEGYARPDGRPTYTGPVAFRPRYDRLVSLVRAGDFEGVVTWIAGLSGPMCYRVLLLDGPNRIAIDLRAP